MSERANELADKLTEAVYEMAAVIRSVPDERWTEIAPKDGRQINVVAYHIAASSTNLFGIAQKILNDEETPPFTLETIEAENDRQMATKGDITKDEVMAELRTTGRTAAETVRTLNDEDLAKSGAFSLNDSGRITVDALLAEVFIPHAMDHLQSIKDAIA